MFFKAYQPIVFYLSFTFKYNAPNRMKKSNGMEYFNQLTDKQGQVMKNLSNDKERKHKHSLGHAICLPYPFMPKLFSISANYFCFLHVIISKGNYLRAEQI